MVTAIEPETKALAEWRKARYLSQVDLARLIGVHEQTVWSWEKGRVKPAYRHVRKLAQALGIEPGQIEEAQR